MRHTRTSNTVSGALRSLAACGAITEAERTAYERDLSNEAAKRETWAELVARFGMRDASESNACRVTFSVPTARGIVSTYNTASAA